jgi:hypothetical protein
MNGLSTPVLSLKTGGWSRDASKAMVSEPWSNITL